MFMDQPNAISRYEPAGVPLYPRQAPGNYLRTLPDRLHSIDDYWTVLWRHKLVFVAFLAGCALFGGALTFLLPKVYQASIALEFQNSPDANLRMVTIDPTIPADAIAADIYIQTKMELFKSRSLLESVNRTLAARQWTEPPSLRQKLVTAWHNLLKQPDRGKNARLIASAADKVKVASVHGTRIVKLSCESSVPALAAAYVNTLAEEFILRSDLEKGQNSQGTALSRQLIELRRDLERSQDALQTYAQQQGLVMTSENDNAAEDRLKQLQTELSRAQAERIVAQSRLEAASTARPESLGEVLDNGPLREYQGKLTELKRELAEAAVMYTPNYYKVKQLQAEIKELTQTIEAEHTNIVNRIRKDFEAGKRREQLLTGEFNSQQKLTADQSNKAIRYGVLKQNVESNRKLYDAMLQRVKEAGISSAIQGSGLRIVDLAEPPEDPIQPSMFLNTALSLMTGVVLGISFIFLRERRDQLLRRPGDSVQHVLLPELGVIPVDPELETARSTHVLGDGARPYLWRSWSGLQGRSRRGLAACGSRSFRIVPVGAGVDSLQRFFRAEARHRRG